MCLSLLRGHHSICPSCNIEAVLLPPSTEYELRIAEQNLQLQQEMRMCQLSQDQIGRANKGEGLRAAPSCSCKLHGSMC